MDFLQPVIDALLRLMETIGGPGAGLAVALENLFPPIPSELILPLAGFTAAQGRMGLVEAIVWTTIGSTVGAVALYYLGSAIGRDRLLQLADRLPLANSRDVIRAEHWFERHGPWAVFLGRMVPMVRSLISIPAGLSKMSIVRFVLLTAAGSAIWNSVLIFAGWELGSNWQAVESAVGTYQNVVLAVLAAAVVFWVVRKVRGRNDPERSTQPTAG